MNLRGSQLARLQYFSTGGFYVVTDPYEDDDDQPTLQRPSGSMPIATARSAECASDGGFPDEEDTAVDREPLAASSADDTATARLAKAATRLPEAGATLPADGEQDTATLPIDIATALRRAST